MDVTASEDQVMLQETTRRFVEGRAPVAALRKRVDAGEALDRELWREGAEMGWTALFVPEADGGFAESAEGVVDAAIVAEELGRMVFAGPFMPACVLAFAIASAGTDAQRAAWLPGLVSGETLGAWAYAVPGVKGGADAGGVQAVRSGNGFILTGTAAYVESAEAADMLLVSAAGEGGVSQFLVPKGTAGVTLQSLEALDLGRSFANVQFADVQLDAGHLLGEAAGAAGLFERQLQIALALQCAETVGATDRALEFTLEWVQQRYAFGRPIGSFQALKHRLADHAAQLEGMKAAAAHAAKSVQAGAPDAAIAVSVAKSHCGRFATEIIRDCVQMHGGIGVTWDHDIHFYLRRVVSNEALLGTPAVHHERLCRLAGL